MRDDAGKITFFVTSCAVVFSWVATRSWWWARLGAERLARPASFLSARPLTPPQSTYCSQVQAHCASVGRTVHVVNLDPAADRFEYSVSGDVRELVSLEVRSPSAAPALGSPARAGCDGGAETGAERRAAVLYGVPGASGPRGGGTARAWLNAGHRRSTWSG